MQPTDATSCSLMGDACTGIKCCLDLDLVITNASVTAWVFVDPCDYTFSIGFENWLFNGSVFNYEWGKYITGIYHGF